MRPKHKDDTPFSYQKWAGVKIRKVQFSSGLAGPKHCRPENRRGNFHYLTKEQREEIEWRKDSYYVINGFEAHGEEFRAVGQLAEASWVWFSAAVVVLRRFGAQKGCIAVYPSGKWETKSSMNWKPELEHFKM